MKQFRADLHIHTALSPCSADEMTPPAVVEAARRKGLAMIAICDHNAADNVAAVQEAAGEDVAVIAGIEITTAEDVHVLGLFPDASAARSVGEEVKVGLPDVGEADVKLGDQLVMDAEGNVVRRESKMLAASSTRDLSGSVDLIHRCGGLAVASHVDRPAFGVIGQLGLFPRDARFDGVELSAAGAASGRQGEFLSLGLALIASSDSHYLSDVGNCWTVLRMAEATFDELACAFRGIDGRGCCIA